jgi:hypothetical protein
VAAARLVVSCVRPGARLGLFGVPWCLTDHDGAIRHVIGQDYRALGGYVDVIVISPMVYHRMCGLDRGGHGGSSALVGPADLADHPSGG